MAQSKLSRSSSSSVIKRYKVKPRIQSTLSQENPYGLKSPVKAKVTFLGDTYKLNQQYRVGGIIYKDYNNSIRTLQSMLMEEFPNTGVKKFNYSWQFYRLMKGISESNLEGNLYFVLVDF